jgi:hypothetical protein
LYASKEVMVSSVQEADWLEIVIRQLSVWLKLRTL